jgi:hypothetical protein
MPHDKGDIRDSISAPVTPFLYESKGTDKKANPATAEVAYKIWAEALAVGRTPALIVEFLRMRAPAPQKWAMIPWDTFLELTGRNPADEP